MAGSSAKPIKQGLGLALIALMLGLALAALPQSAVAQQPTKAASVQTSAPRDGQRDFDWEFGTWTTNVRVLRNPLSGAPPQWVEFHGTSIVSPILSGRANMVELSVKSGTGAIEGVALRLYSPKSRQWSLNYATVSGGAMTAPVFGQFDGKGRGEFYGQDTLDGRNILVRFVIIQLSPNEARFEQSYSADGGKSWELNWLAVDTRQATPGQARKN